MAQVEDSSVVRFVILFQDLRLTGGVRQALRLLDDFPSGAVTICLVPRTKNTLRSYLGFVRDLFIALKNKPASVKLRVTFSPLMASEAQCVITTSKRTLAYVRNPSSEFHIHYFQHVEFWDFLNSLNFLEFCRKRGYPSAEQMSLLLNDANRSSDDTYLRVLRDIKNVFTVSTFLKEVLLFFNPEANIEVKTVTPHIAFAPGDDTNKDVDILFFIRGLPFKGDDMSRELVAYYSARPLKISVIASRKLNENYPSNVNVFVRPDDNLVAQLYSQSKVVVHPSLSEGFGSIPQEALSFGCMVVGSRTGWLLDVTHCQSLKVINIHQFEAYKNAIDDLLEK